MKRWMQAGPLSNNPRHGATFLAAIAWACSPGAPPESPPERSTDAAEEPIEPEPTAQEDQEPPPVSDSEPVPTSAEPQPDPAKIVGELCTAICDRVAANCSTRSAGFCRASCGDYQSGAETCPTEIHAALSCQKSADDFLLCSNIAAESCAPLYKQMQDCRKGKAEPKPWGHEAGAESDDEAPAGFSRRPVPGAGFSHFIPQGANVDPGKDGMFVIRGKQSGATYLVEAVSRGNKEKISAKSLLRAATGYVGGDCQPKLRLHGRYETGPVVHTRFDTVCADGTEIRGMMHFWNENIVAASVRRASAAGELDENPTLEPFIFSFELEPSN